MLKFLFRIKSDFENVYCILNESTDCILCLTPDELLKRLSIERIDGIDYDDNINLISIEHAIDVIDLEGNGDALNIQGVIQYKKNDQVKVGKNYKGSKDTIVLTKPYRVIGKLNNITILYKSQKTCLDYLINYEDDFDTVSNYLDQTRVAVTEKMKTLPIEDRKYRFPFLQLDIGDTVIGNFDDLAIKINTDRKDIEKIIGTPIYSLHKFVVSPIACKDVDLSMLSIENLYIGRKIFAESMKANYVRFFKQDLSYLSDLANVFGSNNAIDIVDFSKCYNDVVSDDKDYYFIDTKLRLNNNLCFIIIPKGATKFKNCIIRDNDNIKEFKESYINDINIGHQTRNIAYYRSAYVKYVLMGKQGIYLIEI